MRNIKILGVAMVAMLAMSVAASAAQATTSFTSSAKGLTLSGTQGSKLAFVTVAGGNKCASGSFGGTTTGTSFVEQKISANFSECFAGNVSMTSCFYVFSAQSGQVEVRCSVLGDKIDEPVSGLFNCTFTIVAQKLSGITYASNGSGVLISISVNGIKYVASGSGCGAAEGEHSDGALVGTFSLSASGGSISVD